MNQVKFSKNIWDLLNQLYQLFSSLVVFDIFPMIHWFKANRWLQARRQRLEWDVGAQPLPVAAVTHGLASSGACGADLQLCGEGTWERWENPCHLLILLWGDRILWNYVKLTVCPTPSLVNFIFSSRIQQLEIHKPTLWFFVDDCRQVPKEAWPRDWAAKGVKTW